MNASPALGPKASHTHAGLESGTPERYRGIVRAAHWLTVLAVGAAYALVEFGDEDETGAGTTLMQGHYLAGLLVLLLLAIRLPALAMGRIPPITPAPGRLATLAARSTHLALYAFLLAQPVLGILQVNLEGDAVTLPWLGWSLPMLVHADHAWSERVGELHEVLGEIFYWVIGLHVAAALWHHLVRRDNTLRRMV